MLRRYRGLRFVGRLFRACAWLTLAAGLVAGLLTLAGMLAAGQWGPPQASVRTTALGSVLILLLTFLGFALLYGLAELIDLLLAIEVRSADLVRRARARRAETNQARQ